MTKKQKEFPLTQVLTNATVCLFALACAQWFEFEHTAGTFEGMKVTSSAIFLFLTVAIIVPIGQLIFHIGKWHSS